MTDAFLPSVQGADGREIPVRKIAWGEKITEPGVYDVPMAWYHADCCAGPSISSGGLRKIFKYSPAHYWKNSYLNPNRKDDPETEDTRAMRVGRAVHTKTFEPTLYADTYINRPAAFPDWKTKAAREWRANAQSEGFTVLEPSDHEAVLGMAGALRAHPLMMEGLLDGDVERSIVWQDKKTGVWLKSRPDAIPRGTNLLGDLKATTDCRSLPLTRKIFDMGYDMQMALGTIGMHEVLGRTIEDHVIVGVEMKEPHAIRVAPIAPVDIFWGAIFCRVALDRFAACLVDGFWPSFDEEDGAPVSRHPAEHQRLEKLQASGALPKEF